MAQNFKKNLQFYKFCMYGFLKNLRFFEPFLVLFFLERGLSYMQIGTLYAVRELATNILEIPAGVIADAMGRRRTMISAFIAYILSFLIFNFSSGFYFFILAMIFFSFGQAFRTGTHKAMIFDYLKIKGWDDQKVYYYGHTRSWSQIGSAISSLIAAFIVFYTGSFRVIFLYSVIPYVLDMLLMVSYPKELDGHLKAFEKRRVGENIKEVVRDFVYSFKDRFMLKSIANLSFYTGFYKAAKDYLQPILNSFALALPILLAWEDRRRSSIIIGIVYFLLHLMTSYVSRHSGAFAEKYKNLPLLMNITMVVGYMTGLLSGFFTIIGIPMFSIIFYLGIYLIQNLRRPIGIANVSDMMKHNILATALSVESQVSSLSAAIIALVIGFFADRFGIGTALVIVPAFMLLTAPFYFVKGRNLKSL